MYLKFYEMAKKQAKNNIINPFIHADFPKEYFIEERENIIYIYRIREWGEYILIDTSYFNSEHKLQFLKHNSLLEIDLEYNYFKKLLDKRKNIC